MTENKWFISTDIYEMVQTVKRQLPKSTYESRMRAWITACREFINRRQIDLAWADISSAYMLEECLKSWAGDRFSQLNNNWNIYIEVLSRPKRCDILREVVGNPFIQNILPYETCLSCLGWGVLNTGDKHVVNCEKCSGKGKTPSRWRNSTVLSLSEAIYKEIDPTTGRLSPARLSILADSLEDLDFPQKIINNNTEITHPLIAHLRSKETHIKGCWAVDTLLEAFS